MLARYQYADAYTSEELRREYAASDWRGRIRILRRHLRRRDLPNEITDLARKDDLVEVRQWWARHAPLSDEGRKQMLGDPDPFVRACLLENPHCLPYANLLVDWKPAFQECTHLERLALVRNPRIPKDLIERLFDIADTELAIDVTERHQLALAVLTNEPLFRHLEKEAGLTDDYTTDGYSRVRAGAFLTGLWEKASAWPDGAAIRHLTYQHVPAFDAVKASAYARSSTSLRGAIFENCGPHDRETLKLAMMDPDELRRYQAYATAGDLSDDEVQALIASADSLSLDAACCNRALGVEVRYKILKRLRELGHNDEPWLDDAEREIASQAIGDQDEIDGVEDDDTIIDNSALARRISEFARRQRRCDRSLSRRLTGIEAVLAAIWAYAEVAPELLILVVGGISLSWLGWVLLPPWLGVLGICLTIGAVGLVGSSKHEQARHRARQLFASTRKAPE